MLLSLALLACTSAPVDTGAGAPTVVPAAPALRRLTRDQYHLAVQHLLGDDVVLPTALEPDSSQDGLLSVGASVASVSSLGVERYEDAALDLAEQVFEDPDRYDRVVPCQASGPDDAACAEQVVRTFGRRAWRRPLSDQEVSRLADLVTGIGAEAGDFDTGLLYGLGAILQSPWFLYRVEHGTPHPDDPDLRLLTDWELATRLSFFLWNAPPDDELLDAAEAGELSSPGGLRTQAERLLADPRAGQGIRALFSDVLGLYDLDEVTKDPSIYTHASSELPAAAREETLLGIEALVLDEDGDLRDLFTTRRTFVDPRLAALYEVEAPELSGFGEAWLPDDGRRRGLLGQASILMLYAHSTRSSATLRGKFVRTRLLCQPIPSPPSDVDTSIPEADADAPTLRDRVAAHLEDPSCAGCHQVMDPIGLALENFDGIARWRDTENGALIDASGNLDGAAYDDAWGLAGALAAHPNIAPCTTTHVYQYAVGHGLSDSELELRDWLALGFSYDGHSVQGLILALVESEGFQQVGALSEQAGTESGGDR